MWGTLFRVSLAYAPFFWTCFLYDTCRVSRVLSEFMRIATHFSAGEDSVLQTEKTEKTWADFGRFQRKMSFAMTATGEKYGSATRSNTWSWWHGCGHKKAPWEKAREIQWWSIWDLNSWPPRCQRGALANWANTPHQVCAVNISSFRGKSNRKRKKTKKNGSSTVSDKEKGRKVG